MPITVTRTLYLLSELPTEKAKERARDWWRALESEDPGLADDHNASLEAALAFVRSYRSAHTIDDMRVTVEGFRKPEAEGGKCCPWTGYCGDESAIDGILESLASGDETVEDVVEYIKEYMAREWKAELESRMAAEYADDTCDENEHYFDENGKHVRVNTSAKK